MKKKRRKFNEKWTNWTRTTHKLFSDKDVYMIAKTLVPVDFVIEFTNLTLVEGQRRARCSSIVARY